MYGIVVSKAIKPIAQGGAIGTHNIKHKAARFQAAQKIFVGSTRCFEVQEQNFMDITVPMAKWAMANYWLVIPLVFCENRNVNVIRQAFEEALALVSLNLTKLFERFDLTLQRRKDGFYFKYIITNWKVKWPIAAIQNIDGVKMMLHEGGCGGGTRQDAQTLLHVISRIHS